MLQKRTLRKQAMYTISYLAVYCYWKCRIHGMQLTRKVHTCESTRKMIWKSLYINLHAHSTFNWNTRRDGSSKGEESHDSIAFSVVHNPRKLRLVHLLRDIKRESYILCLTNSRVCLQYVFNFGQLQPLPASLDLLVLSIGNISNTQKNGKEESSFRI